MKDYHRCQRKKAQKAANRTVRRNPARVRRRPQQQKQFYVYVSDFCTHITDLKIKHRSYKQKKRRRGGSGHPKFNKKRDRYYNSTRKIIRI